MARFGLRKMIDLFKRPKSNQKHHAHERLFPGIPSHPVGKATSSPSTVVTELIRRMLGKPADTVLCTHNVTVTTQTAMSSAVVGNDEQVTCASGDGPEIVDVESASLKDNGGVEIAPTNVTSPPTTIDSATQTSLVAEEVLHEHDRRGNIGSRDDFITCDEPLSHTTYRSTSSSTHSKGANDISEHRARLNANDREWINRPRSLRSIEQSTILDPGSLSEVQKPEHYFDADERDFPVESMSQVSEDDEEEDEELVDPEELRGDWAPIMAIPQDPFVLALMQHLPEGHGCSTEDIRCINEIKGGFNFVRIFKVNAGICAGRYVIKVPCTGTAARWQDSDAYMLRNDARTMAYIAEKTTIPSPKVLDYSDSLSNVLTAPYVIMHANEGIPSNKIWFERDDEGCDDLENAYKPFRTRMAIRINFLRSLASQMAKLQTLDFNAAGTLDFDTDPSRPVVGPSYHWKDKSDLLELTIPELATPASTDCIPPFYTSAEYFMTALNEHWPKQDAPKSHIRNGRRHIMERILASTPFSWSKKNGDVKESFVLRHDDLDFQNILCDEAGNVTGIIDWDKVRTAPRCLGFSSLPAFLTKDWTPDFTTYEEVHMPWELDEYRNVYARAMLEATEDGKYTVKSAIYQAVDAALYGGHNGGSTSFLVRKVLKELESTRKLEDADVLTRLGEGWEHGAWKVREEIQELVKPDEALDVMEPSLFGNV